MERKFAIVTDSSCDMPEEYLSEHQLECVRLGFLMDSVLYSGEDGETIDTHDFYERVRKGAMPTTHQVNVENAKAHIEKFLKAGRDVLVIAFSSGLSGTANSFFVAAKELNEKYPDRKVLVTDSLCASMGEGLYLDYAVKKADSGASLQETYDYLESIKLNICHFFTVDNLFKKPVRRAASAADGFQRRWPLSERCSPSSPSCTSTTKGISSPSAKPWGGKNPSRRSSTK